jgi:hypothetical protein
LSDDLSARLPTIFSANFHLFCSRIVSVGCVLHTIIFRQKKTVRGTHPTLALDMIGDTQLAIDSHNQLNSIKGDGASYLIVYSILQTLLLQQDAAKHIGGALGIKVKLPKPLASVGWVERQRNPPSELIE